MYRQPRLLCFISFSTSQRPIMHVMKDIKTIKCCYPSGIQSVIVYMKVTSCFVINSSRRNKTVWAHYVFTQLFLVVSYIFLGMNSNTFLNLRTSLNFRFPIIISFYFKYIFMLISQNTIKFNTVSMELKTILLLQRITPLSLKKVKIM